MLVCPFDEKLQRTSAHRVCGLIVYDCSPLQSFGKLSFISDPSLPSSYYKYSSLISFDGRKIVAEYEHFHINVHAKSD